MVQYSTWSDILQNTNAKPLLQFISSCGQRETPTHVSILSLRAAMQNIIALTVTFYHNKLNSDYKQ